MSADPTVSTKPLPPVLAAKRAPLQPRGVELSCGVCIALPAALGWFGAWLSVSRHLQRIEPA